MPLGVIGVKIGMTRIYDVDNRKLIPVTLIWVPDNVILELKSKEKHGYLAVKLGTIPVKKIHKLNKPYRTYFEKLAKHLEETLNITL